MGGSLPHSCPQLPPVRDVLARDAQRTSPQHRRTARHARVARRSLPRGIPTPVRTNWRAAQRTGSYRARDASGRSPHPALVADANVILSSVTGGRARLVIASVPGAARNTRIPASHERQCARGARSSDWPCRVGLQPGRASGANGRCAPRRVLRRLFTSAQRQERVVGCVRQRGALRAANVLVRAAPFVKEHW